MKYDTEKFYPCYSTRVYEHLRRHGYDTFKDESNNFTGQFLNIKTNKICQVFEKSPELCACVAEVSKKLKL